MAADLWICHEPTYGWVVTRGTGTDEWHATLLEAITAAEDDGPWSWDKDPYGSRFVHPPLAPGAGVIAARSVLRAEA